MAQSVTATTVQHTQVRHRNGDEKSSVGVDVPVLEGKDDFFWAYTEEPHKSRRHEIIKAHPEVLKLCGTEPLTIPLVFAVVSLQIACSYALRSAPVLSWQFILTAYIIGATANQNLFLAIHEISHNLAFKSPRANQALAVVANLPIGVPYSASFRPYHLTHHKSLGVDGLDTDLPTALEAWFLDSVAGKAFFCTFQIFFYAVRPMMVYQIPITWFHAVNVVVQVLFDCGIVYLWGHQSLRYFILSSFFAGSLHPCGGHFFEHYIFGQHTRSLDQAAGPSSTLVTPTETYSYYGPLNYLTYNVGLHNEHHDFPAIPWSRLWKLNEIANEFYKDLPSHDSWVWVMWQFIVDKEVGLWCRVKRKQGGRKVGAGHAQPLN